MVGSPQLPCHCQVAERIKGSVSSKLHGYESLLAPLIAEACIDVVPTNPANFNVDNVRVVKISGEVGGSVGSSGGVPVPCRLAARQDQLLPKCPRPCAAGGGLHDSHVVKGMVLKRDVEGSMKAVADARVAVFAQGVDTAGTETKVRGRYQAGGPGVGWRQLLSSDG